VVIDLRQFVAEALMKGHTRNRGATSLFINQIASYLAPVLNGTTSEGIARIVLSLLRSITTSDWSAATKSYAIVV
jgi:hypothetical protein